MHGYKLEPPCPDGSNEYSQSMFWIKNKKKIGLSRAVKPSFTTNWCVRGFIFHGHVILTNPKLQTFTNFSLAVQPNSVGLVDKQTLVSHYEAQLLRAKSA